MRVLAIMGSGETSPTMVTTHRELFAALGPSAPAVVLDTPFGFQENADDIAARAVEYFRESVGRPVEVASMRTAPLDPFAHEAIRSARWVFAGPGSPSYALRVWRDSPVPDLLADKLRTEGCMVFASAAALTLGALTVPVYEIYKVGEEPRWLEGLDLLGSVLGLCVAVIPHFNNAEGGNHDTRYCYLGERRLRMLEASMPDDAFVLGVDEHTGLVLDLDAGSARVVGLGSVTVRRGDAQTVFPAGSVVDIAALRPGQSVLVAPDTHMRIERDQNGSLSETVGRWEAAFDEALAAEDGEAAARAVLALEDELVAWSRDTLQSDEADRARGTLRSMIVRLGQAVRPLGPFVEALLTGRAAAREAGRYAEADDIRDTLVALGVEVNDSRQGTTWRLLS